jgi:hypothetical protein
MIVFDGVTCRLQQGAGLPRYEVKKGDRKPPLFSLSMEKTGQLPVNCPYSEYRSAPRLTVRADLYPDNRTK